MKKKVSIVMATYNGDKYIRKQLDSILNNNKFVPVGPNLYWLGIMEDFSYPTK